jgi:hypothetical protein
MKQEDRDGYKIFMDGRNIQVGNGRILWGSETQVGSGKRFKEGWVLPGGFRTRDEDEARAWAKWINEVTK